MTDEVIEKVRAAVVAVPPLARHDDLRIDAEANHELARYLLGRGVTTLLYGGNANLYHIGLADYEAMLEALMPLEKVGALVLPAAGPDFGKLMDQAPLLRRHDAKTAMVLPQDRFIVETGVERALRLFVDAFGRPATLYLRGERYLSPERIARLLEEGVVELVKYAIERAEPLDDPYLGELVRLAPAARIVSGDGEGPALDHIFGFGLAGFTSGAVCLAPRAANAMLEAARAGERDRAEALRRRFMPFDRLRRQHGPAPVLHDAITLSGLAEMGRIAPMLDHVPAELRPTLTDAAHALLALEAEHEPG